MVTSKVKSQKRTWKERLLNKLRNPTFEDSNLMNGKVKWMLWPIILKIK